MNVVSLVGNLATEVELRETGSGKKRAYFRLAVARPTPREADFVPVIVWERQAEVCAEHLTKGQRVAVDGRLRSSSWETPQGERRSSLEVVANRVEFLSPPEQEAEVVPFERTAAAS